MVVIVMQLMTQVSPMPTDSFHRRVLFHSSTPEQSDVSHGQIPCRLVKQETCHPHREKEPRALFPG
jgi:hypothetical protein